MKFETVFIKTLGCKVNAFDSDVIEQKFRGKGYRMVSSAAEADVTIINTCSVTKAAEKEAQYLLRRYTRENPETFRVVTGCYAQTKQEELQKLKEIDLVVSNEKKEQLVSFVESKGRCANGESTIEDKLAFSKRQLLQFQSSDVFFDTPFRKRTRSYVKIQDGCNSFCAYCQIPYARGSSRSVSEDQVVSHIKTLINEGVGEVVLTGIDVGDYGKDFDQTKQIVSLATLLRKVFQLNGLKRLRLSSIEPGDVSDELLEVLKENEKIFCDHFHLPLQSGSDAILKRMGRQYNCKEYYDLVGKIRHLFPAAMISADVIPGFPFETEALFEETLDFIQRCNLSMLHVFPYSKRPNTRALNMPEHVDPALIKKRASLLRELSKKQLARFCKTFVGTKASVLWEEKTDSQNRKIGKTRNYLDVVLSNNELSSSLPNKASDVLLKGLVGTTTLLGVRTS